MIQIKYDGDRIYPLLLCDECGERIVSGGNVLYPSDDQDGPPRFVHKDCDDHTADGWEELQVFFYQLIHNAKVDLVEGEKAQRLCEQIDG